MGVGSYPLPNTQGPVGATGATGSTGSTGSTGATGATGPSLQPLTFTAKSADYTAASGDFVQMTGSHTVSLPSPTAGRTVGVSSVNGTGAAPAKVTTASGSIIGAGWSVSGSTAALLGIPGAYVVLEADGTNWNVIAGEFDSGWIGLSYNNNWGDYATRVAAGFVLGQYRKIGDIVHLRGLLNKSTAATAAPETVATLPAGYRPVSGELYDQPGSYSSGSIVYRVDIAAAGTINVADWAGGYIVGGGGSAPFLSLSGMTFSVSS